MKYSAEEYHGNKVGTAGVHFRLGVQIVATDDTGTRRNVFTDMKNGRPYKTACLKMWEGVAHYKSGLNQQDVMAFNEAMQDAERLAAEWNFSGTHSL